MLGIHSTPDGNGVASSKALQAKQQKPPVIPSVGLEHIPDEMRRSGHFVLWHYIFDDEAKDDEKAWRKVPIQVTNGHNASTTAPDTWASFESAAQKYEAMQSPCGLGYVFAKVDTRYKKVSSQDADDLGFTDLDHCRNRETGEIAEWAWEIVRKFNSYCEASPSGTGVHLYWLGSVPNAKKVGNVEIYDRGRYSTLSGQHIVGTPEAVNPAQEAADWLVARLEQERLASNGHERTYTRSTRVGVRKPVNLTDAALLNKAREAKNGQLFHTLFDDGAWETRCPSQSEAVMALLRKLAFWTGGDTERMDRLFRASALFSGKWEGKWDDLRGDTTLGWLQILKIVNDPDQDYYVQQSGLDQEFAELDTNTPRTLRILSDVEAQLLRPAPGLVGNVLYTNSLAILYGPWGSWKTFVALSMALSVGVGGFWLDRDVRGTSDVLDICAEGAQGIGIRIGAWKAYCGMSQSTPARFTLVADTVNMLRAEDVDLLIGEIEQRHIKPALIVLDTVAWAMLGADENDATAVGMLIAAMRRLREKYGCCVLGVHHTGKDPDRGARGSYAFGANVDTVIKVGLRLRMWWTFEDEESS